MVEEEKEQQGEDEEKKNLNLVVHTMILNAKRLNWCRRNESK